MRVRITEAELKRCGMKTTKPKAAKKQAKPTKGDLAADAVIAWCKRNGLPQPMREWRFHDSRRWRFDLSWEFCEGVKLVRVAVEINGGGWVNGRHNRASSLEAEYTKLATAAAMGWRVIPITYGQLNRGELWPLLEMALAELT